MGNTLVPIVPKKHGTHYDAERLHETCDTVIIVVGVDGEL